MAMSLSMSEQIGLASELWAAEQSGRYVELPTERYPGLTWDDARAVAVTVDELRRAAGCVQIGYKLGWTSEVMRRSLGIQQPNWGTLWAHQRIGLSFDIGSLRHPKIEPEIVYRCGRPLSGVDVTADDVLRAADGWALGLEVVHPRFVDFGFLWLDNTADNSSSEAIAFGEFTMLDRRNPADIEIVFSDGGERREGSGSAAMGSPAEAVAWLVAALSSEGQHLEAGQIVFTGGLAAPFDVAAGSRYEVGSTELAAVAFDATDDVV